jgi:hypothetical protein
LLNFEEYIAKQVHVSWWINDLTQLETHPSRKGTTPVRCSGFFQNAVLRPATGEQSFP